MDDRNTSFTRKRKTKTSLTLSKKSKRYRINRTSTPTLPQPPLTSDSELDSDSINSESGFLSTTNNSNGSNENLVTNLVIPSNCGPRKEKAVQVSPRVKNIASQTRHKVARPKSTQTYFTAAKPRTSPIRKNMKIVPERQRRNQQHVDTNASRLCARLRRNGTLDTFADVLHNNGQTAKFVNCITALAEGYMLFTNMAWKAFLDMGTLYMCSSTTTMEYDSEWLEFCQVIYHMFGAGVINALRGRGHFSQVTSERTSKGKYKPIDGEFNFPIPSIPTLKKLDIGFPSEIPVGFVEQSLQLAQKKSEEGSQFILSFDGKLIAPGCKGEQNGDTNLWGVEGPPSLPFSVQILKRTLRTAEAIDVDMGDTSVLSHYYNLKTLLNVSTRRIRRLRGRITGSFYLKKKLIDKCGDSQELQYKHRRRMSTLNQNTADCESVVRRLLELNFSLTSVMSSLNGNGDTHVSDNVRHVQLSDRGNVFQLLPPEVVSFTMDLDKPENFHFVKQRSDKWFQMRKESRVTGSTLNSAIGLDTLQKQKDHHYIHIRGRKPPPIPPELQKKFDHGTRNEVNATSTLMTTVVPAYLPACYAFFEVGGTYIHGDNLEKLMEVSADGILQCHQGDTECPNYNVHGDRRIVVEIKSPVPQENVAETIYYDVPARYMPQIQAEMTAYLCDELWLVCSTAISASVIVVYKDEELWNNIWERVKQLYDLTKPNIPTRLDPQVKALKLQIVQSIKSSSRLMCEVPTVTGEYGPLTVTPDFSSPFCPAPGREKVTPQSDTITELNNKISVDAKCAFKQCHEVLRDPGKELLVFMLTDKDRKQDKNEPYSYPVAYALKGSSMTNAHLEHLVNNVREELIKRDIPLLAECYDGQWHKFVTHSCKGKRLTRLHSRDNWNKFSSMTKDKCLQNIADLCVVKKSCQQLILSTEIERGSYKTFPNIIIKRRQNGVFSVTTEKELMGLLHSVHPVSRPDLFTITEIHDMDQLEPGQILLETEKYLRDEHGWKVKRKRLYRCSSLYQEDKIDTLKENKKCRVIGLQGSEKNLLDVVKGNSFFRDENNEVENINPDTVTGGLSHNEQSLDSYLFSDNSSILQNILNELSNAFPNKWSDKTVHDLYPELLASPQNLLSKATLKELIIIGMELRCATGRTWYSANSVKADIANIIAKAFGSSCSVTVQRRKKKVHNPETLFNSCIGFIKNSSFPVEHLQIPIASLHLMMNRNEWYQNSTLPTQSYVTSETGATSRVIEFFSYPEFSAERQQMEFRTFDFTHILTNLRTQILTRGLDYCKKEHFHHLCENRPDILSIALVHEKTDQQNAFTAMRMFSVEVERYMRDNNFDDTADFIKLVRNWHDACNKRGIKADVRVSRLCDMHEFLTKGINFDCVPFQYPGRYIKGLTWQTYEAMLQVISTRIQLYYFARGGTYNARAVSTLANESFFADLVRYDKESHGYPKGTNVSRVFGRVVLINHFKHKSSKNYCLAATVKSKYEVKLAERNYEKYCAETTHNYDGMFRNHFFDYPDKHKSHRVRRDDITTGLNPPRTSGGVRRWFKTIEADILPEVRGGNKVKGFNLSKNPY